MAQGERIIQAAQGITVDLPQNGEVTQQSVSRTIDAMVQADPELAWLQDMEQRGDIDWRQVKETHDSWSYDHSGMSGAAQLVVAIVVTYFTAGAASGAIAGATGSAAAGAAGGAVAGAVASNAAVSTINNEGNLGNALDDTFSSDAVRGYAVAGITAGLTAGFYDGLIGTETGTSTAVSNSGNVVTNAGLDTWQGVGQFTANQVLQNSTSALLDQALGGDADLGDALQNSLANAFAAAGFNAIGDFTQDSVNFSEGSLSKAALHGVMGGLAAEATGGDFKTGALAAGINELLVDKLANEYAGMSPDKKAGLLVMNSQLIGVLAAAATGGVNDADNLQVGAQVAANATQYNYLRHDQVDAYAKELEGCAERGDCKDVRDKYIDISEKQQQELVSYCAAGAVACQTKRSQLLADEDKFYSSLERLDQVAVGEASRDPVFARMQYIDAVAAGAEEEVVQDLMVHAGLDREEASYLKDVAVATVAASTSLLGPRRGASQTDSSSTRTLTAAEISGAQLPGLPNGYHYRVTGSEVQVVRSPGQAGNLPQMHLEGGKLVPGPKPGVIRSTATRSAFLRSLADSDKIPSNIRPWLERGEVPPGYAVHHNKALFDGGTDTVDNMVLQGVDLHKATHRFYRPGGKVPSINPPPTNPY
ncbi:DUF637 domain-containing protein [Halomonas binhaiensis]|uniref:DUF637 domain-containing protein n=1 Tax=Halomonas binhaiensis TaxID=2562282 RepID=A0A856QLR6_9GAMM|nr:DUF637 domain-containing protein [Halomonas binhaiensis]QEM80902.2 DUF637 domain-containing protein [Halomonas binhaiensis]